MRVMCQICQERLESELACGPCGHTFHHACLTRWLSQSASCPLCRTTCCLGQAIKLYLDELTIEDSPDLTMEDVQAELECCRNKVQDREKELTERDATIRSLTEELTAWQARYESTCSQLREEQCTTSTLRSQIRDMDKDIAKKQRIEAECKVLEQRLSLVESVETVLRSGKEEVAEMMHKYRGDSSPAACNKLATCLTMLKNEYELLKLKKRDAVEQRDSLQKDLHQQKCHLYEVEMQLKVCQGRLSDAESDISHLEAEREGLQENVRSLEKALVSPSLKSFKRTRIAETSFSYSEHGTDNTVTSGTSKKTKLDSGSHPCIGKGFLQPRSLQLQEDISLQDFDTQVKTNSENRKPAIEKRSIQPSNLQLQKKILMRDSQSQFVRKGYNGFGGHSKFRLQQQSKKGIVKPKGHFSSRVS